MRRNSHWKNNRLPLSSTLSSMARISFFRTSGSSGSATLVLPPVVVGSDVLVVPAGHVAVLDDAGHDCGLVDAEIHRKVRPVREVEIYIQPAAVAVLVAVGDVVERLAVDFPILLAQFRLPLFVEPI